MTAPRLSRRTLLESVGAGAAAYLLPGCIPEARLKRDLEMEPRDLGDGWPIASPEDVGLVRARVREAYERVFSEDEFLNAVSLLVVCRGKLVAEGYTQAPSDATRRDHVQSVTKSLTSLAFGLAREDGVFPDLEAPLARFVEVRDEAKRAMTLRHLLTMRSGIDVDNETFAIETTMRRRKHVTRWLLDRPLVAPPGGAFIYRDGDTQLLGAAIRSATGRSVETIVTEQIFAPLGIRDTAWEHDADDEPFLPFGAWLRPRDCAKIIELVRLRGSWGGRRVVPASWLDEATRLQVEVPPEEGYGFHYGYYFWIVPELEAFAARGHGGNVLLTVPSHELVIVLTGSPDADWRIASSLSDVVALAKNILRP